MFSVVKVPSKENLYAAISLLKKGEVIAFPTETVYGIGVSVDASKESLSKIFSLKGRAAHKQLGLYVADRQQLEEWVPGALSDIGEKLFEEFLPGPLTIIVPNTNKALSEAATLAIRCSSDSVLQQLLALHGKPLWGTSANLSERPSSVTAQEVLYNFPQGLPIILDGGQSKYSLESTIIALSSLKILRNGCIAKEELEMVLKQTLE